VKLSLHSITHGERSQKMKYIITTLLGIALVLSLNAKEIEPSTNDLMKAMSAYYFERTLPKELKEDEFVYLSLLYPDGKTRDLDGGNGFKAGDKVKVFTFLRSNNPYVTLLKSNGDSMTANGLPKWGGFSPSQKKEGKADDYMIRFSTDGSFIPGHKPRESGYDLIITTKKN